MIRNLTYTHTEGERSTTREIAREHLVALLDAVFDIDVPAGASFAALDGA